MCGSQSPPNNTNARAVARDLARLLVKDVDTENEIYHFLVDEITELGGGRVAVVMFRLRHVEAEDAKADGEKLLEEVITRNR